MRARGGGNGDDEGGEGPAASPRLAASQLKRLRRIVDAAVRLAEQGGFGGVRLRDVAEESGVALGTLYRYFRSKEDILVYALTEEIDALEQRIAAKPPAGSTPLERVVAFFSTATRGMTRKPNFARAVLRAMASGEAETTSRVAAFHLRLSAMILAAIRDVPLDPGAHKSGLDEGTREAAVAAVLQQVWFAALVGWLGGLNTPKGVVGHVGTAASLLLEQELPRG
jgi:AcrR family transcriptional regulator